MRQGWKIVVLTRGDLSDGVCMTAGNPGSNGGTERTEVIRRPRSTRNAGKLRTWGRAEREDVYWKVNHAYIHRRTCPNVHWDSSLVGEVRAGSHEDLQGVRSMQKGYGSTRTLPDGKQYKLLFVPYPAPRIVHKPERFNSLTIHSIIIGSFVSKEDKHQK
jgi:hypothetical protein